MRLGQMGPVGAAVLLGAGLLAACGAGSVSTVPPGPLSNAYQLTQAARSTKMALAISIKEASSAQPVKVSGSGAYAWSPLRGTLTLVVGAGSQHLSLPERLIGTQDYIEFPAPVAQFGNKRWLGIDLSQFFSGASSTSFDPSQELALLQGDASGVIATGHQTVDGIAATGYRGAIDTAKVSADSSSAVRKVLQRIRSAGLTSIPITVWLDGTGRPVRMVVTETLTKPPAGSPYTESALFPETTTITIDFSGWGSPVTVTAPPKSAVYQISPQQLQQLGL